MLSLTAAIDTPHGDASKISATPPSKQLNAPRWQKAQGNGLCQGPFPFPCKASKSWGQGEPQPAMLTVLSLPTALPLAGQIKRGRKMPSEA